jgi:hypothetical protein
MRISKGHILLLTKTVGNKFVRETLASLKGSVITFLHGPDITVGTAVTVLRNLNHTSGMYQLPNPISEFSPLRP